MHRPRLARCAASFLALAALLLVATGPLLADAHTEKKSLYTRLGGYDAIAAVVDDFIGRLVADPKLAKFFSGHGTDSKRRIRQHVVDQLCAAAGGPCVYTGRDMKTSHAGLGISKAEWDAGVAHLAATLDRFKVPKAERDELFAAIGPLEKDIVEAGAARR